MLAPRPTPKLEDHPSSAVRDCLFNLFAAALLNGGRSSIRNLRTRHAVVTGTHYIDETKVIRVKIQRNISYFLHELPYFLLFSINKIKQNKIYTLSDTAFCSFYCYSIIDHGHGSSVGIATGLQAGWSGIESRWGRDFLPVQTGPGAHLTSCKVSTGSFPGVKCGRGVLLNIYPLLVPRSWKSRAIPLPTLWTTPGL